MEKHNQKESDTKTSSNAHEQQGFLIQCSSLCTASSTPYSLILGCYFVITTLAVPAFYYSFRYQISFNVCSFRDSFMLSIIEWKSSVIPYPDLAEILYDGTFSFLDIYSICFYVQQFWVFWRSFLFPMRADTECAYLCSLQNYNHLAAFSRERGSPISYTINAQCESLRQLGIRALNRSCPAVSHSCSRQVLFSCVIFLTRKSIPMVAQIANIHTLQVSQNLSLMNRSIIEDLPTC